MLPAAIMFALVPFSLLALAFGAAHAGCSPPPVKTAYWYEVIQHNGISAAIPNGKNWKVFRNVKDYGAKGDGTTDDTAAIQRAINTGDSTGTRDAGVFGSTGQPAVVYFPAGTYVVKSTINSTVGTVIMGDPTNRATIKAASKFTGDYLLFGHDKTYAGLVGFFHGVKNLVLDSTAVSGPITLLEWSVSQNNQLTNVLFNMPVGATTHTGIATQGLNSGLLINDNEFRGGGVGINLVATQYHLKSLVFKSMTPSPFPQCLFQVANQGALRINVADNWALRRQNRNPPCQCAPSHCPGNEIRGLLRRHRRQHGQRHAEPDRFQCH